MRIANGVYVLPIPRSPQEPESFLNLTLIMDEQNGNTLVDAGLPNQTEAISTALVEAGIRVGDLRRIIFTHQDLDHVGSGAALVRQSDARVLAHPADAPYIEGRLRPLKPTPEMLEQRPQMRKVLERLEPVPVDEQVENGSRLDLAGGTQVVFHTGSHAGSHKSLPGGIKDLDRRRRADRRGRLSEWPQPIGYPRHAHSHTVHTKAGRSRYRHHYLLPRRRG